MFSLDFTDKKVFITGAGGNLGSAIARAFHARGATVGIHDITMDALNELADELSNRVQLFSADLNKPKEAVQLGRKVEADMDGVDILVNNAGITKDTPLARMQDEDWEAVMQVNLNAAFCLCRELIQPMRHRKFGRIINITSVVASTGNVGQTNYAASKGGLVSFSKSLAREAAAKKVTVNCVAPGFVQSEMTDKLNEEQKKAILDHIPMKAIGNAENVADAVAFLASDGASYITGETLHVNGGMAMV